MSGYLNFISKIKNVSIKSLEKKDSRILDEIDGKQNSKP
jgi:hypothetical protein